MSTVESGNKFRDTIRDLVKLAGWRPDTERLVGGKKADLLFSRILVGRRSTLAVEAKNYATALGQNEVEKIVGAYVAAQHANEIDELWIVAPQELKGGKEFIDTLKWVRFFTQQSLLLALMDFSAYLSNIILEHEQSGLENYFISPRARFEDSPTDSFALIDYLDSWQDGSDRKPIAVVEGYGTGKTSIARHLTYKLASRCLEGRTSRIPIYVELGRLTSQQRLNGLFTALFASDHQVDNFSFALFRRMNYMGCFLVILDGFDEMKHLMTPSDFEFNFGQLNQLVEGDARVILLGRPSAFSSGEERQYLLHGHRVLDGDVSRDPGKPNYVEIRLLPFDKEQVAAFVERFLRYKANNVAAGAEPLSEVNIQARLKEIKENDYGDLLERPVQARMLAELAISHSRPLGELTRFTLYRRFMDELIRREMEKEARQQFTSDIRRHFSQELSWWMWSTNHTLGVRLQEIPTELFRPFSVTPAPMDAVRRDLVSGSFLDAKDADLFIVPHRSMIEFSVAERIIAEASDGGVDGEFLKGSWRLLTPDVLAFILESGSAATLTSLMQSLGEYMGGLSNLFLDQLARSREFIKVVEREAPSSWSPWHLHIYCRGLVAAAFADVEGQLIATERALIRVYAELERVTRQYLNTQEQEGTRLASALLALLPCSTFNAIADDVMRLAVDIFLRHAAIPRLKFSDDDKKQRTIILDTRDLHGKIIDAFRRSVRGDTSSGVLRIIVSFADLAGRIGNHLHPRYSLDDSPKGAGNQGSGFPAWSIVGLVASAAFPFNDFRNEDTKERWEVLRRYLTAAPKVVIKEVHNASERVGGRPKT